MHQKPWNFSHRHNYDPVTENLDYFSAGGQVVPQQRKGHSRSLVVDEATCPAGDYLRAKTKNIYKAWLKDRGFTEEQIRIIELYQPSGKDFEVFLYFYRSNLGMDKAGYLPWNPTMKKVKEPLDPPSPLLKIAKSYDISNYQDGRLSEGQAARALQLKLSTLKNYRMKQLGPRYYVIDAQFFYYADDLIKWLVKDSKRLAKIKA